MQALARKVAQSDNRLPIITRLRDDDPLDVIIHGVSLTCDQLRMVYRQALSRCKTLLEDLLLGLTWSAENVYDNFGNRTVGFQIMADRNASNDVVVRSSLLKHILCSEELRRRFVLSIGNGNKVLYRSSEATNYLNVYDEYIENLLLVVHVGSGMPARATELETYRVKNGPSTSRNVFYLKPQVFFHCEYSKSRSIRAANKGVSRFMNEEASLVLLKDLLVVRPFVCSIATFLELNPDDIYSIDLFVRSGVKLEALSLRNAFARLFYNYCHTAISFGEYRHIAKYYCRQLHITDDNPNCSADNDGESDKDPDSSSNLWELVLNKQFGHSSVIANRWYAVRNGEHTRMRDHILQQFRTLSRTWHLFLTGKSSSTKRKLEEVSGTQDGPCVMAVRALKEGDNTQLHIPRIGTSSMQRCSSEQKQFVTIKQSSDTLDSLKLLYRDANVTFKSSEQRAAAENVLHTNSDILAILPTGCGKSLLFFLYSFKYSTLTNIVIVPTLSLQSDLKRRAECHRISCSISLSLVANEQLVILTPEAVISQEGSELIMRLYGADQLGKIFVDEVHLFSTDGEFRPMFHQLPTLRFMPVSFVLMTATAPEWVVSDILKCFFAPGRMPLVIRQQTNRLNISYETKMGAQVGDLTNQCAVNLSTYTEDERSIIYVPAIDLVTRVKEAFVLEGIPCSTYTGQQMLDENRDNFASWRDGETKIMIATSVFGLGVDYDQVRHVLFFGLPHSLEDFRQQSGRAGRDGKPSSALLMFDARKEHFKMDQLPNDQKKCFEVMMTFATTTSVCRRRILSRYFDGKEIECSYNVDCQYCDVCRGHNKVRAAGQAVAGSSTLSQEKEYQIDGLDEDMLAEFSYGQNLLSTQRNLGDQLWFYVAKYEKQCIVCHMAKGTVVQHSARNCPTTYGLCYRCFNSGHGSASCKVVSQTISGACARCWLPLKLGSVVFHPNGFNQCSFRDTLKFYSRAAVKFGGITDVQWLYRRDSNGILNLWSNFVHFCEGNI